MDDTSMREALPGPKKRGASLGRKPIGIHWFVDHAASKGGKCLSTHYESHKSRLDFECGEGHRWSASAKAIRNGGSWCPSCARQRRLSGEAPAKVRPPSKSLELTRAMARYAASNGEKLITSIVRSKRSEVVFERADGTTWATFAFKVVAALSKPVTSVTSVKAELPRTYFELTRAMERYAASRGEKLITSIVRSKRSEVVFERADGTTWATFVVKVVAELAKAGETTQPTELDKGPDRTEPSTTLVDPPSRSRARRAGPPRPSTLRKLFAAAENIGASLAGTCESDGHQFIAVVFKDGSRDTLPAEKALAQLKSVAWEAERDARKARRSEARSARTIEEAKALASLRGGKCLSTSWEATAKLDFECARGHRWSATWANVKGNGSWCAECAVEQRRGAKSKLRGESPDRQGGALKWFKDHAERLGGRCLSSAYGNVTGKLDFERSEGHRWSTGAGYVKSSGSWCRACARLAPKVNYLPIVRAFAASRGETVVSDVVDTRTASVVFARPDGTRWAMPVWKILRAIDVETGKVTAREPPAAARVGAARRMG